MNKNETTALKKVCMSNYVPLVFKNKQYLVTKDKDTPHTRHFNSDQDKHIGLASVTKSKHYLVEGKRRCPRLSAYENPRIPAYNPQESSDALALLKDHWCR